MDNPEIKALIPISCPSCKEQMIVEFVVTAPKLSEVFTAQGIDDAKRDAIQRIGELDVPKTISAPIIEWINNPETIFTSNDIAEILKGIESEPKKDTTEEK